MNAYPKAYLYRRIVKAKLFIDAHFAEPIDVDAISNKAAFSKFHFIRLFKQVYGATPRAYLSKLRLDRAKLLLDEGTSVSDACNAAGFQSLSTFSRSFKRRMGSSPSSYRETRAQRIRSMVAQPMAFIPPCYALWSGWTELSNPG